MLKLAETLEGMTDAQVEALAAERYERRVCVICEAPLPRELPSAELKALGWQSLAPSNWLTRPDRVSPRLLCPSCARHA
ncbi:hypothetical protein [Deinococcus humi]|uniref:Uncharacterized protein n=1 Tax=Deinococcus humi TaxID=662880 RepID=A0A7W8ND78_9DEIO|nr:hypothetical protein [Deinococcus humi]MBB5361350.1 hypothetical protein [Deinococcus humi]GGO19584.1 hypothetical protein GCM10008949_04130 [Deinococcus humi]